MLFPYHSDAPLYHYPLATVGLIVVNVLLFFLWPPNFGNHSPPGVPLPNPNGASEALEEQVLAHLGLEEEEQFDPHPDWRMLHLGTGLRPWQWVTANFIHADILHLFGNMIFLWGLGIVVEGKLGWWRFLLVYLLIGAVGLGIVQIILLPASDSNALGASLAIFGVMMLALLWAPLNELSCVLFLGIRFLFVNVTILMFSGFYLGLQVFFIFLGAYLHGGVSISSEVLHLLGAFVALPIGIVMLKRKMVDCENWDAFSVWQGKHELSRDERRELEEKSPEFLAKVASKQEESLARVQELIEVERDPGAAWDLHLRMRHRYTDWILPEATARAMIRLYHEQRKVAEAAPAMIDFLRRYPPQRTTDVRLMLAQHMIRDADRPRQGLRLLAVLDPAQLGPAQAQAYDKLQQLARQKVEEVELEEATEEW